MPETTLENERLRLSIDPEKGAGVTALSLKKGGRWLPLMPDTREKGSVLETACFLMIPYSNRIENGVFTFGGREYRLADGADHAIHGDTRSRPWSVTKKTETVLSCAFDSTAHKNVNWPWPFQARVEYALKENLFSSRLTLWNRGDSPMPAGFGWHPYFSRRLTEAGEPVSLRMKARGVYPDDHDNRIPSGPPHPPATGRDFSEERDLKADAFIDACYHGYDGNGHIHWPRSGIKLTFDCSPACTHLVIYNPPDPYFAVEPVTNANNGVNLLAQGEPSSGITSLSPGESLDGTFTLKVDAL